MKNQMKGRNGITLIALLITIIVLLILAGVAIATLTGDNGLLTKAGNAKNTSEKGEIEEQVKLAYNEWKLRKETGETVDLQNTVQTTLDKMYDNATVNKQGKAISINVKGNEFTLVDDGTMEEGKLAYLDIADGNIDLYSNGYKQYTGNLQGLNKNGVTEYTGKYIITGTTTENVVRVCDEGTFNITIKDLDINVSAKSYICAFNANSGNKATGCYVNIFIEGENKLIGCGQGSGLGFSNGTPNVNGVTNGSTLTIDGNGKLYAEGGTFMAGIGSGHGSPSGSANNIIINGGDITAASILHGPAIGGGHYNGANNIIINGGNINLKCGEYGSGIGTGGTEQGIADNIIINGGNINVQSGGIGSNNSGSGKLQIKGGYIKSNSLLGKKCNEVIITGGTLNGTNIWGTMISCDERGTISITGGSVFARGKNNLNIATYEEGTSNLVPYTPKNGTNDLYETQIKLQNVGENKKVTKLTTSDNIEYGINDMYTLENGMLYLYLPAGTRTITIEVDGKTYSGTVATTETPEEVTLNEVN